MAAGQGGGGEFNTHLQIPMNVHIAEILRSRISDPGTLLTIEICLNQCSAFPEMVEICLDPFSVFLGILDSAWLWPPQTKYIFFFRVATPHETWCDLHAYRCMHGVLC